MKKKSGILIIVSLVSTAAFLLVSQILASTPQGSGSVTSGFITEFPIPTANGNPQNLVIESSGTSASIWFTMPDADAIGNLVVTSTVDFNFTTYDASDGISVNSTPYDLVYDASRNLIWFTEKDGNRLGALNIATGVVAETAVTNNQSPHSIAISPDGNIWFTQPAANFVARYVPGTGTFTYFTYKNATGTPVDGRPTKITVQNNDAIWVTAPNSNQIGRLKPSTDEFTVAIVADFGSPAIPPSDILYFANDTWIATSANDRIGRYIPQTLSGFQWFSLPSENGGINSLSMSQIGDDKVLWFTEPNYGRVGRITLNNTYKVTATMLHGLSTPNSFPTDIVTDAQNNAWIANQGGLTIAKWSAPYSESNFLPIILKPN